MKNILYIIIYLGALTSCSEPISDEKKVVSIEALKPNVQHSKTKQPKQLIYGQIRLEENSIDSFPLPFPEKNMIWVLTSYYAPYWVEANLGEQDGPNFIYIDILRLYTPIIYFNFDSENQYLLNSITVFDSIVSDQYGLHVGDSIMKIQDKRGIGRINFDPYHQHVYYFYENSNISYEINGDLKIPAEIIDMEDLTITENDITGWTIEHIIWRKK